MGTASATRSISSTRTTTSAASEEALAHRDADLSSRKRRRVIDSVIHYLGRLEPSLDGDRCDLVRRVAIGQQGIEVERCADRLCRHRHVWTPLADQGLFWLCAGPGCGHVFGLT